MCKIFYYNAQSILEDHEHYSTIERIFALSCINAIVESVRPEETDSIECYINCAEGVDIHDYIGENISTMCDGEKAFSKVKAIYSEHSDEEVRNIARDMISKFWVEIDFAKMEFDCLINLGVIKPSKS